MYFKWDLFRRHIKKWGYVAKNGFKWLFFCMEKTHVRPSVRPSAVDHSCRLHNFDTVRDNFTKLGTNIKPDQTACRD